MQCQKMTKKKKAKIIHYMNETINAYFAQPLFDFLHLCMVCFGSLTIGPHPMPVETRTQRRLRENAESRAHPIDLTLDAPAQAPPLPLPTPPPVPPAGDEQTVRACHEGGSKVE